MNNLENWLFDNPRLDKFMTKASIGTCILAVVYMSWHVWRWFVC